MMFNHGDGDDIHFPIRALVFCLVWIGVFTIVYFFGPWLEKRFNVNQPRKISKRKLIKPRKLRPRIFKK